MLWKSGSFRQKYERKGDIYVNDENAVSFIQNASNRPFLQVLIIQTNSIFIEEKYEKNSQKSIAFIMSEQTYLKPWITRQFSPKFKGRSIYIRNNEHFNNDN